MRYRFPKNFLYGSATSSPQTYGFQEGERGIGHNSDTIWEYWWKNNPERFFNRDQVRNEGYKRYKEDIAIAKSLNFNVLRTSISWARLIPNGKDVCQTTADHYNKVIDEMLSVGIKPMLVLFHFDMPMWAQKIGGWENREVVDAFAFYAKTCFKLFGSKVKSWFTFNEPTVIHVAGYIINAHYPCVVDFKRAYQVQYNLIIAHAKAVHEFRKLQIKDAEIGIILNILEPIPRSQNKADVRAARIADELLHNCYLNPAVHGTFTTFFINFMKDNDLVTQKQEGDEETLKLGKIDILGVNYYNPTRVKVPNYAWNPSAPISFEKFFEEYTPPVRRMNLSRGWEIYPKALYNVLKNIQNNYGNIKTYVTENGIGIQDEEKFMNDKGIVQDDYRIEFIGEHMAWVSKAISEGANCHGYMMWTYIDNWSWANGYKNRYGYIRLDTKTSERIEKKSASWIRKVILNNEVEANI